MWILHQEFSSSGDWKDNTIMRGVKQNHPNILVLVEGFCFWDCEGGQALCGGTDSVGRSRHALIALPYMV